MDAVLSGTEAGIRLADGSFALEGVSVSALAAHPSDSRVLFAASEAGAYATRDSGATWEPIGLDGENLWTIAARREPRVGVALYAGAEPAALHRTRWGATAWERLDRLERAPGAEGWHSPWGPADLSSISFAEDAIYVGIEVGGVYRSRDGGATWEPLNEGLYEDVHTVVGTRRALYAATGAGFYRRADGRWEKAGRGLDRPYVMPIVVDPSGPAHLWTAGAAGPPPMWRRGAGAQAFESRDAAASWTPLPPLPPEVRGAIPRKGLALAGSGLVAGTTDGYLLRFDGAWEVLADGLPPVAAVLVA